MTLPIVENYYNSETVEQKAMFTLCKVTVKLMFTLSKKNRQIIAKCAHEFYSTLCKVCTWVLLNTLQQFHEFFLTLFVFVVFNNVNTVRSEMGVWGFPNHSCQKFLTNHLSSTCDLTRFLAFVIWKTPYSHFLLTVFSQSSN
jgi:hypothetical protein